MDHRHDPNLILDYLEGELGAADRARVDAALDADPELADLVRQMRRGREALRQAPPLEPPSDLAGAAVLALEREMLFAGDDTPAEDAAPGRGWRLVPLLTYGGIAAVLAVTATVVLQSLQPQEPAAPSVAWAPSDPGVGLLEAPIEAQRRARVRDEEGRDRGLGRAAATSIEHDEETGLQEKAEFFWSDPRPQAHSLFGDDASSAPQEPVTPDTPPQLAVATPPPVLEAAPLSGFSDIPATAETEEALLDLAPTPAQASQPLFSAFQGYEPPTDDRTDAHDQAASNPKPDRALAFDVTSAAASPPAVVLKTPTPLETRRRLEAWAKLHHATLVEATTPRHSPTTVRLRVAPRHLETLTAWPPEPLPASAWWRGPSLRPPVVVEVVIQPVPTPLR